MPKYREATQLATCSKCGKELAFFPDPDDDEMRNWASLEHGSYCPADGYDHNPINVREPTSA